MADQLSARPASTQGSGTDVDAVLASVGLAAADLPRDLVDKMRVRARDPQLRLQIGRFVIGLRSPG